MLICWSGGADSTCAVYLQGIIKPRRLIRTISFRHPQIRAYAEQKRARDLLLPLLAEKQIWIERLEVEVGCSRQAVGCVGGNGNFQAPYWLVNAVTFLDNDEDLVMGWVRGDDVWHDIEKIKVAFSALQEVMHKTGKLLLPLEFVDKAEVYKSLKEQGLFDATWTCEKPTKKGRACGRCHSCVVKRNTLKCM